jgi:hypothetical protein
MLVARWLVPGLCLPLAAWAGPPDAAAAFEMVPAPRQALILMRALAYDEDLHVRAGGTINVAVVFKRGSVDSEAMAARMVRAFAALAVTEVAGLPVAASSVAYGGPESLRKAVATGGIDAIYVCDGLESEIAAVAEISRQAKALTLGSRAEYVRAGLSLGVFGGGGKTVILLNLPASRQEGAKFAADLLRLATVLR